MPTDVKIRARLAFLATVFFFAAIGRALPATVQTTRISVTSTGTQANGPSSVPSVSGDGRYIVFVSQAPNLTAETSATSVILHDNQTGQTTKIGDGSNARITNDGKYVIYTPAGQPQYSLSSYDVTNGTTHTLFTASASTLGSSASDDGRYVASMITVSVPMFGYNYELVMLDQQTGWSGIVWSGACDTLSCSSPVGPAVISPDGTLIAVATSSGNLRPSYSSAQLQVFDVSKFEATGVATVVFTQLGQSCLSVCTGTTATAVAVSTDDQYLLTSAGLIALATGTQVFASPGTVQAVSANGQFVTYTSGTPAQVYRYDQALKTTVQASVASDQTLGNAAASASTVDNLGHVAYQSSANNLVAGDTNGVDDIFETTRTSVRSPVFDFNGDGKADLLVFRPGSGSWFVGNGTLGSGSAQLIASSQLGQAGDVAVPADYDGDGQTDYAVYRPSSGTWYVLTSSSGFTATLTFSLGRGTDAPIPGDYDGDGKTDPAVYRPSTGAWYILTSSSQYKTTLTYQLGQRRDIPVPGDYDGDGKTDLAVYRPSNGMWYINTSSSQYNSSLSYQWGLLGDVPVPGDYDGDGKADLAVWRPSTGTWYIEWSASNFSTATSMQWGLNGDTPATLDYDGDGKVDLTVWRPSTGMWYVRTSNTQYAASVAYQWGLPGDVPAPNAVSNAATVVRRTTANVTHTLDIDGDGVGDPTVFRPSTGTWFVRDSSNALGSWWSLQWGLPGDTAVASDFDGDGKADVTIWRPSTGAWYIRTSSSNFTSVLQSQWGVNGDIPVPGDYDGDGRADIAVFRPSTGMWYFLQSSSGYKTATTLQWGLPGDVPVPGDYSGSGVAEPVVYRPSTGTWYFQIEGYYIQWGLPGDVPMPGDYDGDGKLDVAVWRPSNGTWYILTSSSQYTTQLAYQWGLPDDTPVSGDYDGDGETDLAVYRPSTGMWYVRTSSSGFSTYFALQWGLAGDTPRP